MPRARLLLCLAAAAGACSNFYMKYQSHKYRISARTEDMVDFIPDVINVFPRGRAARPPDSLAWKARYGFVGFRGASDPFVDDPADNIYDGLNEMGLSCASLTLDGAQYPGSPTKGSKLNLDAPFLCRWVLENFASVEEASQALAPMTVFSRAKSSGFSEHFYVADEHGQGLVVEWIGGTMQLTKDFNDHGHTGFGIVTNAPPFAWQVENVRHHHWKLNANFHGRALPVPGGFYPDDRFLRIHMLKSAVEERAGPATLREAVGRAVSVLNSVQVPPGSPVATDAGGDHTKWAVVRDHKNRQIFFRSLNSPSLQLVALQKFDLAPGAPVVALSTELPADAAWCEDVSSRFTKREHRSTGVVSLLKVVATLAGMVALAVLSIYAWRLVRLWWLEGWPVWEALGAAPLPRSSRQGAKSVQLAPPRSGSSF